jgi:hypothetical protein
MQNVLLYGFSTIASTLGSAVGLIVAAAIFRTQKLDQIGSNLYELLIDYLPDAGRARMRCLRGVHHWKKHREAWDEAWKKTNQTPQEEDIADQKDLLDLLDRVRDRVEFIRRTVRVLVPLTLTLIAWCFIGLGLTLCFESHNFWLFRNPQSSMGSINPFLTVTILFAIALLAGYGYLIWRLLADVDYSFRHGDESEKGSAQTQPGGR